MSNILYNADNISVIWNIKVYDNYSEVQVNPKKTYWIELIFNIFINWKLKSIKKDFPITKWTTHDYEFVDYSNWYLIHELLKDLWYLIKEQWRDDELTYSCNIINQWIHIITKDYEIEM